MNNKPLLLALDQGTTSSRAIVFDVDANIISVAQYEFPQHYPQNGWVEHDPEDIWQTTIKSAKEALSDAENANKGTVVAIGITNQRETTFLWDRQTGKPLHNAIVWQDRRTTPLCKQLKEAGKEALISEKTGLLLDPYFSASKLHWLLNNVPGARVRADRGELAFGTVDSFLISKLTLGKQHLTDATNASRTSLFNIHNGEWDADLLQLFDIPSNVLPQVKNCADDFGVCDARFFGREIPILGVAGDQHAASIGQACFSEGDIKSTYGTGCFVVVNTGSSALKSENRLLTTLAYQIKNERTYALEGSIFIAGAAMQWLRDGLGLIKNAKDSAALASELESNDGVYLVPAFTGLGAPWWQPEARGAIVGLTRATTPAHFVRAALEAVCYQTADLLSAIQADGCTPKRVRVDGGMVANNWMNQFLANILSLPIDKPKILETTALGAAYLAGLQYGLYKDVAEIQQRWQLKESFEPHMPESQKARLLSEWKSAVNAVLQVQR